MKARSRHNFRHLEVDQQYPPVKYTLPLVLNNYRCGVEIPALHTVSNKPPHPLKVAITLDYRYQPGARAPIDAGKLVADNGKIDGYRY